VVYGEFSFRESSLEFEYGLRHVLLAHGRIGKIFVDYAEEKQMPKSRGIFLLGKEMHKAASA
jgi:hypothetical protein